MPLDGASLKEPMREPEIGQVSAGAGERVVDRVDERRRAVALARHFREEEGLSIAQIADRLGRSPATIKAYFYDPTGEKAKAVPRLGYRGLCRGCGADTQPRNGKAMPTPTAGRAIPGLPTEGGRAAAYSKRCAIGSSGTDSFPRLMTGLAHTPVDAGARLSDLERWRAAGGERGDGAIWQLARSASRLYESEWRCEDSQETSKQSGR